MPGVRRQSERAAHIVQSSYFLVTQPAREDAGHRWVRPLFYAKFAEGITQALS
jgi:hypothetical protein